MPEEWAPQVEEFTSTTVGWTRTTSKTAPHRRLRGRRLPLELRREARSPGSGRSGSTTLFEEHGWQSTHTVVEMVNDDMPFLVDSTRMEINRQKLRDTHDPAPPHEGAPRRRGQARRGPPPDSDEEDAISESIHVEVDRQTEPAVLEDLKASIEKTLADVRQPSRTGFEMRERVER